MTETAAQLLETFDSLPPKEQHELLTIMLRRTGELSDGVLTDDALVGIADVVFQALDAEETNRDGGESR